MPIVTGGVPTRLSVLSFDESVALASGVLVTLNAQHLYTLEANEALRACLIGSAGVFFCVDGRGARAVLTRALRRSVPLAAGNEIVLHALLSGRFERVAVIGSTPLVRDLVRAKFPTIDFVWLTGRFDCGTPHQAEEAARIVMQNVGEDCQAVFVALGVPKQELLAVKLRPLSPSIPIMCVGGSFEILAGSLRRAPKVFQRAGLEPLWRLVLQPNGERLRRMLLSYVYVVRRLVRPQPLIKALREVSS